jgi:hypothetical protein
MLYPVLAGILKICGKTILFLLVGDVFCQDIRSLQIINVPLKFYGEKANTAIGEKLVCLLLVNPETQIIISFSVQQKVTE